MKLTEAIKILQEIWRNTKFEDSRKRIAIETVLTYVRDSISKDKVKKKIEEINSVNYEDVKTIENDYDEWFWKTTGAENALKELLGE